MRKMSNTETGARDAKRCASLTSSRSGRLKEALPRFHGATGSAAARAARRPGPRAASALEGSGSDLGLNAQAAKTASVLQLECKPDTLGRLFGLLLAVVLGLGGF